MDIFIQQVVSGLATGGIYASLALALVMIYQATDVVNFAQGELAMFATYICWSSINAGVPYWAAFLLTLKPWESIFFLFPHTKFTALRVLGRFTYDEKILE